MRGEREGNGGAGESQPACEKERRAVPTALRSPPVSVPSQPCHVVVHLVKSRAPWPAEAPREAPQATPCARALS